MQRFVAQEAVDAARHHNIAARHALLSASATASPDLGSSKATAEATWSDLRAAVEVLTALDDADVARVRIDLDVDGLIVVARPHGELNLSCVPQLERMCLEQLDRSPVELLVVDVSAVTFLDVSGLAVLVKLRRVCLDNRTRFAISGPSDKTRRHLEITGLDTVLEII